MRCARTEGAQPAQMQVEVLDCGLENAAEQRQGRVDLLELTNTSCIHESGPSSVCRGNQVPTNPGALWHHLNLWFHRGSILGGLGASWEAVPSALDHYPDHVSLFRWCYLSVGSALLRLSWGVVCFAVFSSRFAPVHACRRLV